MFKQSLSLLLLLLFLLSVGCQTTADPTVTPAPPSPDAPADQLPALLRASRAEWDSATEAEQLVIAGALAEATWLQIFGLPPDLEVMRALPEYRALVTTIHKCIDSNLDASSIVEDVGIECALSTPVIQ
jgi:hypothetical protein